MEDLSKEGSVQAIKRNLEQKFSVSGGTITGHARISSVTVKNDLVVQEDLQVTGNGPHYFSAGNVGIGATAPEQKLHIWTSEVGTANTDSQLVLERNGHSFIQLLSGSASQGGVLFGDAGAAAQSQLFYDHNTNKLNIITDGTSTSAMTIDSSRNVGIGTTNPATKLEVSGGTVTAAAFTMPCPSGFTSIAAQGRQLGCIQTAENGAATWDVAANTCFIDYGGRLPTEAEWFVAANNFTLTDEVDDWEWGATGMRYDGNDYVVHGLTNRWANTVSDVTGTIAYRCWIPK